MIDVIFIIAEKDFRDEELFHTKEEIEKNGFSSIIASKTTGIKTGMLGGKAKAEITLKEINVNDCKAIIFVGGSGSYQYFNDSTALGIAKEAFKKGKIIGAICIAPAILANAEILKGKKATIFKGKEDMIESKGAFYKNSNVVKDGNIITACGPQAAREFGKEIANMLK
ncbi:MAG: DJ-1/PfpI family protein [Candidatus Pacearchaeota archaeon]